MKIKLLPYSDKNPSNKDTLLIRYFFNDSPKEELENFCLPLQPYITVTEIEKLFEKGGIIERKVLDKTEYDHILINIIKRKKSFDPDYFRNDLCGVISDSVKKGISALIVEPLPYSAVSDTFNSEADYINSIIEGILYSGYKFDKYKSEGKSNEEATVFIKYELSDLGAMINSGTNLMNAVKFTRDLQNEPGNSIFPSSLANIITERFKGTKVKVTVYDEKKIAEEKMGGLLAVGKGSSNPPRFIIMEYKGDSRNVVDIALVGKGITFDSGGISLKPAADMWLMKADMSGAAVTAGIIYAAALNQLPVNITGVIAAAENMPSGNALKPGDIITTSSGLTIEVDNTDAEGRIVLTDALHYASKLNPAILIDFATLTGACVVALGEFTAGLMTNNERLAEKLKASSKAVHERIWQLPMWDDFNKQIESDVADVKNLGGRWGGAITAAKFLEKWVEENLPWAHLDIAGPSMPNELKNYTSTYMTGFGVRLIYNFINRFFIRNGENEGK